MTHNSNIQIVKNDKNCSLNLLSNFSLKLLSKIEKNDILLSRKTDIVFHFEQGTC